MRPVLVMLFMLMIYLFIGTVLGLKWVLIISAVLFSVMATVFIIKEDYYIKYIKFVNPSYLKNSEVKGEKFKKQNRVTNIICWYIIAVIFIFQASVMPNMNLLDMFSPKQLIIFAAAIFAFSSILFLLSMFVHKKSKTNSQFIGYSVIIGVVFAIIFLAITGFFVLRGLGTGL